MNETLARHNPDDAAHDAIHVATAANERALMATVAEYQRLQAALARLAALPNSTEAWIETGDYQITIRSLKYYDGYDVCETKHATLLEACEAALREYDALPEDVR